VFTALSAGTQVAGGTAWLWALPAAFQSVDVLFVDEAAQMSLANVLAVSHAARTIVLIGDPQQLDQPMKGSHPDDTEVSALDHILCGKQTISAEKGLFLEETWRLHPSICRFT
jgi:superfamily I DNA and/or RNA helicase